MENYEKGISREQLSSQSIEDQQPVLMAKGSVEFTEAANFGTKIISEGAEQIKENENEYKHNGHEYKQIEDPNPQHAYLAYKNKTNAIKLEIKTKKAELSTYLDDQKDLFAIKEEELTKLESDLKKIKELHPLKLAAITIIFNEITTNQGSSNKFTPAEEMQLHSVIKSAALNVSKKNAEVVDLKDRGFFVISKGSLGDPHVIEIAMRTNEIARGGFGIVSNVKYIHEQKNDSTIIPQIIKIPKDDIEKRGKALRDITFEIENLEMIGGEKGVQAKITVKFKSGYIIEKMEGDGFDLSLLKTITSLVKEKMSQDLIAGVNSLKLNGLFQPDFKPQNTLYKGENLVLSDLGAVRKMRQTIDESDHSRIEEKIFPDRGEILKIGTLPNSVNELFLSTTPPYRSRILYEILEDTLMEAKSKMFALEGAKKRELTYFPARFDNSIYEQKRLTIIKEFNDMAESILYQTVDFALGLSLYSIWVGDEPSLDGFKSDVNLFSSLSEHEHNEIDKNLMIANVPGDIRITILDLLSVALE